MSSWAETLEDVVMRALQATMEATAVHRTVHGRSAFFVPARFPWVASLEAEAEAIIAEYEALEARLELPPVEQITPFNTELSDDGRWRMFVLRDYRGTVSALGRELCPRTLAAIDRIPGVRMAFFSVLEPGKHLPPHRGPYSGILRCHLGIRIPRDAARCRIRVGAEWRQWARGEVLLFDDSLEHEVANDTDERRVVLFIDFLRPLGAPFHRINRWMLEQVFDRTPFANEMHARVLDWEAQQASRP